MLLALVCQLDMVLPKFMYCMLKGQGCILWLPDCCYRGIGCHCADQPEQCNNEERKVFHQVSSLLFHSKTSIISKLYS
jgi:hypothetical protein